MDVRFRLCWGITVTDETVLAETDGIVALDAESGSVRWVSETMRQLGTLNDKVYVMNNQQLQQLGPTSGGAYWETPADKWAADAQLYTTTDASVTAYTDTGAGAQSNETAVFDAGDANTEHEGETEVFETSETTSPDIAYCPVWGRPLRLPERPVLSAVWHRHRPVNGACTRLRAPPHTRDRTAPIRTPEDPHHRLDSSSPGTHSRCRR